jgi:hypothetical protein
MFIFRLGFYFYGFLQYLIAGFNFNAPNGAFAVGFQPKPDRPALKRYFAGPD